MAESLGKESILSGEKFDFPIMKTDFFLKLARTILSFK